MTKEQHFELLVATLAAGKIAGLEASCRYELSEEVQQEVIRNAVPLARFLQSYYDKDEPSTGNTIASN